MGAVPGWKCKRCRHMQTHHEEVQPGVFHCANGRIGTFERFVTKPTRYPQSFSSKEVQLLDFIISGVLRGTDLQVVMRNPVFPKLARKVQTMRTKSKAAAEAHAMRDSA